MRRVTVCLSGALLLAVGPAAAYNEPDGFRGLPWNATEAQLRQQFPAAECRSSGIETRLCRLDFALGDVRMASTLVLRRGRFVRVDLHFASADFESVNAAFVQRYGAPTVRWRGTNEASEWQGQRVNIILLKSEGSTARQGIATVALRPDHELRTRGAREL
jgi:hypothetical protein